jgi:predicted lipid-binding transport protein (Tim44 family)
VRKIIVFTLLFVFLSTVCFAAVSSSGSRSSSGSKSFSAPSSSSSPSKSAAPGNTGGTYKPSAPANSLGDKAPAKQTTPDVQQSNPSQSTGGFWRNASMIGGGFLAGSLFGSLFGGHMGGMSGIFSMLLNLLVIGGVVMLVRNVWDKYKNKDKGRYR